MWNREIKTIPFVIVPLEIKAKTFVSCLTKQQRDDIQMSNKVIQHRRYSNIQKTVLMLTADSLRKISSG